MSCHVVVTRNTKYNARYIPNLNQHQLQCPIPSILTISGLIIIHKQCECKDNIILLFIIGIIHSICKYELQFYHYQSFIINIMDIMSIFAYPNQVSLLSDTDDPLTMTESQKGIAVQHEAKIHSFDQIDDRNSVYKPPHKTTLFEDHGQDLLFLMRRKNNLAGFVLLLGLGLHSFLAGIGFGASVDETQAVSLAIAILAHKYLAAFTLGCPFYKSGVPFKQHLMIGLCFGSITPIGIAIGWSLSAELESWVSDIFISIASGTFIYVAIIEILVPEFSDNRMKEKLRVKTDRKVEELNLGDTVGKRTMAGIKENVADKVSKTEEDRFMRLELMKGLSVFSGFMLMSLLALWV